MKGLETARDLFVALLPDGIAISIISFSEIYEGIYGGRDPVAAEKTFRAFLQRVTVLGINRGVAKRNARLRRELRDRRRAIAHRALDLLIAATALENNLTLVTGNLGDFEDIADLKLYQPASSDRPMLR